jgi:T-complex protein 1 subunit eta
MQNAFQPQIILLKEGTDTSQGKSQIISNINACQAVAETVRTTLGPRGMDKLIFDGKTTTISNDGATIMRLLDIVHPAAKVLVDISMAQDAEVGDGTTSVVLLAAEILKGVKQFVEDGLHPRKYRIAMSFSWSSLLQIDSCLVCPAPVPPLSRPGVLSCPVSASLSFPISSGSGAFALQLNTH